MRYATSRRTKTRATLRSRVIALIVITVTIVGTIVHQTGSSSALSLGDVLGRDNGETPAKRDRPSDVSGQPGRPPQNQDGEPARAEGAVTVQDGLLPDGVTVFDDAYPGVANLEPGLLEALRAAATDAGDEGIVFLINSGWRSPAYQNQLLHEAVAEYGSEEEAARWVATAETSAHVSGDAVDIGPADATDWLSAYGAAYGLCQIYGNEPWHFELRPEAVRTGCPAMYADPTEDPRMQQ
jgi:hypothetical protein